MPSLNNLRNLSKVRSIRSLDVPAPGFDIALPAVTIATNPDFRDLSSSGQGHLCSRSALGPKPGNARRACAQFLGRTTSVSSCDR